MKVIALYLMRFQNLLMAFTVVNNKNDDKWLRCRYETGIVMHIENQGQNIVNVGHLRYWKGDKKKVKIVTSSVNIESLSNEAITI